MQIPENVLLFSFAVVVSLAAVVVYDKLRAHPIITREDYLEEKIKLLTERVAAQQVTIDTLAGRAWQFQKDNDRLRAELVRLVPGGAWRGTEISDTARGLERLTVDEFRELVHQSFPAVFDRISDTQSLHAQRLTLLDYADKHAQSALLRSAILAINPAAFS